MGEKSFLGYCALGYHFGPIGGTFLFFEMVTPLTPLEQKITLDWFRSIFRKLLVY